jgi:hypothetical protein
VVANTSGPSHHDPYTIGTDARTCLDHRADRRQVLGLEWRPLRQGRLRRLERLRWGTTGHDMGNDVEPTNVSDPCARPDAIGILKPAFNMAVYCVVN